MAWIIFRESSSASRSKTKLCPDEAVSTMSLELSRSPTVLHLASRTDSPCERSTTLAGPTEELETTEFGTANPKGIKNP